jgi:hypothetical protein
MNAAADTPRRGPASLVALRATLRRDLASAMKAREPEAVPAPEQAPATTSGHIAGARAGVGAAEAARRNLSVNRQQAILRDQIADCATEADRYEALGQQDAACRLRAQARLLTAYLR